jgi:hypothetical protein
METPTPATPATSVAVLAPYLAHEIEVEIHSPIMPVTSGVLTGLRLHPARHCWLADVRYEGLHVDWPWPLTNMLPRLRPFSSLVLPLPSGEVPAVEVAKLLANDWAAQYSYTLETVAGNRISVALWQWDAEHGETLLGIISILADWNFYLDDEGDIMHFENVIEAYDYLRANHFALPINGRPLVEGIDYLPKP